MLAKLFCKLGFHKWEDTSEPVTGRRNLSHSENGVMILEEGPIETITPSPYGPIIYPTRTCIICNKRQMNYHGRWAGL